MRRVKVLAMAVMIVGLATEMNAQVDTTGISGWKMMYNSMASWEEGAFGAQALGHPDYGWGIYNMLTHAVVGDSLFVIKLQDGSFKKLWIVEKSGTSVYNFRYADLDGSNEKEVDLDMKNYADKHLTYYNLREDSVVDEQPLATDWDLLLTKFTHTGLNYVVTGFLTNDGATVSVLNAADSTSAANSSLADTTVFTDSISAIGNSWYQLQGMSIVPLDTIAYFVKTAGGEIYKMQVTFFESGFSGLGRVGIRKQHFDGTPDPVFVYDTLVMGAFYAAEEFYSMANGSAGRVFREFWDIGFKSGTFTSSIFANTTMGVELYTYPSGDITAWDPATSIAPNEGLIEGIVLYPVPASGQLTIKIASEIQDPLDLNVYDLTGKQVLQQTAESSGSGEFGLDVSGLKSGVYMLRLSNREFQAVRKFSIR